MTQPMTETKKDKIFGVAFFGILVLFCIAAMATIWIAVDRGVTTL